MKRILITGADGFLGRSLVRLLSVSGLCELLIAQDVREVPAQARLPGVVYGRADVRDPNLRLTLMAQRIDTVVHLASIVTPGRHSSRALEYSVDVQGSRNVLEACVAARVEHLLVSSSGAAYGYHADNPAWIDENQPLRGNASFAYSDHKRQVEEMLSEFRETQAQLRQTVFRIGTILGSSVDNQITALFEKPRIIAIRGSASPFVFVWDEDVSAAFVHAVQSGRGGVFNLVGDGALGVRELAALLGKPVRELPPTLLRTALWAGSRLGLSRYGAEQLDFLRYRPVLLNTRLKTELGFVPRKSSREAFEAFVAAREHAGKRVRA